MKPQGVVKVDKTSPKKLEIGGLHSFCPAGCLKHVYIDEDKITQQNWIEGNNLVTHEFMEWVDSGETDSEDYDEENAQDDSDDFDKEKFGVESRAKIEASFAKT